MTLPETTRWLKARSESIEGSGIGVYREARVIRGVVLAQEGPFKTPGRGEFDRKALRQIVQHMKAGPKAGLKSRFAHPTLSDDGVGKYLGRMRNPRLDAVRVRRGRELVAIEAVRADLHFDESASKTPAHGDLADYVMSLAESDPDAISTSLVLTAEQVTRLDPKTNRPQLADDGQPLPPLWYPTALHASDVVDTGDAVDGMLSADGLPDEYVRRGSLLLDAAFPDADRNTLRTRLLNWMDAYLEERYGIETPAGPTDLDRLRKILEPYG